MIKVDQAVIERLRCSFDSNEGALFNNSDGGMAVQLDFIEGVLREFRPRAIIETGTNKAYFCYAALCCLDEYGERVLIDTFDMTAACSRAVAVVNELFPQHLVTFHLGGTDHTLTTWMPDRTIDFAYIDGGHDYNTCVSDIANAGRLGVPVIMLDDTGAETVSRAIENMAKPLGYTFVRRTPESDERALSLYVMRGKA